jgi:T-complex protein 1 subunit beta
VLSNEADEEKAEVARLSSFVGAMAIGDLVKSTLGPKGMDKILWGVGRNEGQVEVTNDGATILKAVGVDNPAAKVLVNMSRVQDDEVGDGTTSVTVLAAELIREAEKLVDMRIHPQTIVAGWRMAAQVARTALEKSALDHGSDADKFREDLVCEITQNRKICLLIELSFLDEHCKNYAQLKNLVPAQGLLFQDGCGRSFKVEKVW